MAELAHAFDCAGLDAAETFQKNIAQRLNHRDRAISSLHGRGPAALVELRTLQSEGEELRSNLRQHLAKLQAEWHALAKATTHLTVWTDSPPPTRIDYSA